VLTLWEARHQTVVFVTHDLSEAITLADRVIVMTRRPGRIKLVHDVPIPRPRDVIKLRETEGYAREYSVMWHGLGATRGAAGVGFGRHDRTARGFEPYIIASHSLPRIGRVPPVAMIFGFRLVAKIVLGWTVVLSTRFFNTFQRTRRADADLTHSAPF